MKAIERILLFSTSKPFIIILLVIIISVSLSFGIQELQFDNDTEGYMNKTDKIYLTLKYLDEVFDDDDTALFLSIEADNIYSFDALNYVYSLHKAIEEIPLVKKVKSIINIEDISGKNDILKYYSLIEEDEKGIRKIPKTDKELSLLRNRVESNDKFTAYIVSNEKNENELPAALNIMINLGNIDDYNEIIEKIENTVNNMQDERFKTYLFGDEYTYKEMNKQSRFDGMTQAFLALFVIFFTYFLNFKSPIGVIFPQITNVIATLWVFSLMGYFGVKISMMGMLILPLLIAVASSYGIHSLNQYYKESQYYTKENKSIDIANSMQHILKTISLAGLTTIIGVSSLAVNKIIHIRTFGIFASLGVLFAVLLSLTLIPALLYIVKIPKKKKALNFNKGIMDKFIKNLIMFNIRNRYFVFIIITVIILISVGGVFLVTTNSSVITMFVEGHEVRQLTDYFSDNFDGTSSMHLIIDTNPEYEKSIRNGIKEVRKKILNNINIDNKSSGDNLEDNSFNSNNQNNLQDDAFGNEDDAFNKNESSFDTSISISDLEAESEKIEQEKAIKSEFLKKIDDLMVYAKSIDGVGRCYSFTDVIKRFHYVMNNEDKNFEVIPDSDQLIVDYISFFSGEDTNSNNFPDAFESLIDPTMNIISIKMNMTNVGERFNHTGDYRNIQRTLSIYIDGNFDTLEIDYYFAGSSTLYMGIQDHVVSGQILAIIFALVVIVILNTILFKSIKSGLISLIPLSIAVIINFGIMGVTGIVLDSATSLISALAIGIGVDDTIHFMLNLRKEIKDDVNKESSIESLIYRTLRYTSKAIIFTSLALIFGFMVVVFSSFMPIRNFSILVSLTMVNATIATLLYLPSILLIFPGIIGVKKREGKAFKYND